MNGINKVELLGNITADPKCGKTAAGKSYAQFTVAINEDYRDKDGKTVKKATFVNVSTFGTQADNCGKYLRKGALVLVNGKIRTTSYTDKEGVKRNGWDVLADNYGVKFLDMKPAEKAEAMPDMPPVDDCAPAEDIPF